MNWKELFQMQQQLDQRIEEEHHLTDQDLFSKKVMALFVELGELANETRCFKFWSSKPAKEQKVILEEYVDGLHFILSLGLEKQLSFQGTGAMLDKEEDTTAQFHKVLGELHLFQQSPTSTHYEQLFYEFLRLGKTLGFEEGEIQEAYYLKNEVNHQRQDQGY